MGFSIFTLIEIFHYILRFLWIQFKTLKKNNRRKEKKFSTNDMVRILWRDRQNARKRRISTIFVQIKTVNAPAPDQQA